MSYLVLARKFRPQSFAAILGQEHISTALANAILRDRVPHALLFCGPRGVGKTTSARVLAKALNCSGPRAVEPCGECVNCTEIAKSSSIAVREIDGASNNGVDNIRELIDSLRSVAPPSSKYKIYIIDEVHMLSIAAFNALLKSLEEPPPNTIFIFATTEPHKVPDTVISRCQRHDFRRIAIEVIVEQLESISKQEKIKLEAGVSFFIARRAAGGMRDAQSMLDRLIAFADQKIKLSDAQNAFGALDQSFFLELSKAVLEKDTPSCFALLDRAFVQSLDLRTFVADFIGHWRALLLVANMPAAKDKGALRRSLEIDEGNFDLLVEQAESSSAFLIGQLFDLADDAAIRAEASAYPRFVFEAGLAKMTAVSSMKSLPEILQLLKEAPALSTAPASISPKKKVNKPVTENTSSEKLTSPPAKIETTLADVPVSAELGISRPEIDEEIEDEVRPDFIPSWSEFIQHVSSRKRPVLEASLKQASPKKFLLGQLTLQAPRFFKEQLSDKEMEGHIQECLHSYSGTSSWKLEYEVLEQSAAQVSNEPKASASKKRAPKIEAPKPLEGSIAAEEAEDDRKFREKIREEVLKDPLVDLVLKTFEGAEIDDIQPLGKNKQ
ncbi:UNVERIFIED_CONTAM: hypothetical protein GTU68_060571 [Idotea baltica]|nr:hypothetical protein [Idotea baltica]